ncbi:MAG: hypothetical protein KIT84_10320 [Labilithrix sp.]|nr:hypothetical protein [Labilithrix sp.]MCW5811399.1 hypothetical protein [Labilithrix sp.]
MDRAVVSRLVKRARRRWPELGAVTDAELEAFVRARVPPDTREDDVRIEDLLLVCACAKGVRSAEDAMHELFAGEIDRAHARTRPPISAVQARHLVFKRYLAIAEGGAARVALYRGDSDFASWMRNAINRTLLETASQARPPPDSIEDGLLKKEAAPIAALDPEIQRVKQNYLPGLRLALTHTLSSLEARERALLRNAIVDGLDASSLGLMYGMTIEETRAVLGAARERLLHRLRQGLAERMRVSDRDHAALARFVSAQLEAALAKALEAPV